MFSVLLNVETQALFILSQAGDWFLEVPGFEEIKIRIETVVKPLIAANQRPIHGESLESRVVMAYRERYSFMKLLETCSKIQEDGEKFQQALEQLQSFWEELHLHVQLKSLENDPLNQLFQEYLAQFEKCAKELIYVAYGQKAAVNTRRLLFAEHWLKTLEKNKEALTGKPYQLKREKRNYMEMFVRDCTKEVCLARFFQAKSESPANLIGYLENTSLALVEKIDRMEENLSGNSRSFFQGFLYDNSYIATARFFYQAAEDLTQTGICQQVPILKEKLEPCYLELFSRIGGWLFFFIDLYGMRLLGPTHSCLLGITEMLCLDPNLALRLSQNDERVALGRIKKLEWTLQLTLFLGMQLHVQGISKESFLQGLMSYMIARSFVQMSSKAVDHYYHKSAGAASYRATRGISQLISFTAGLYTTAFIWREFANFFPSREKLMSDPIACQRHSLECRKIAFEILELPEGAPPETIRKKFRELTWRHHPDQQGDRDMMQSISWARDVLL